MAGYVLQLNPDKELLIIGFTYAVLSSIVFPVYALIIYALYARSELRDNISYKLINIINYSNVSQALCHFLTGLFLIFPTFTDRFEVFVRVVGCSANTLWLATFVVMLVLAFTRIGIAFYNTQHNKWSSWMIIALSVGCIYILFVWIAGCVTQNMMLSGPSWSYDFDVKYAGLFADLELALSFPTLLISFFSYVVIIFSIYRKKRHARGTSSFRVELGIVIQATVLTAYMATLITLWHNAEAWFKMTNVTLAFLNGLWILFSHLNAVMLISTNSGVRRQIVNLLLNRDLSRRTSRLGPPSRVSSTVLVRK